MFNLSTLMLVIVVSVFRVAELEAGELGKPDFMAEVVSVDSTGALYLEGNGRYRLWGLVILDPEFLRELVVGRDLGCYIAGELTGKWRGFSVSSKAAICISFELNPASMIPEGLIGHLLQTGHAKELCSETLGLFGTCEKITK